MLRAACCLVAVVMTAACVEEIKPPQPVPRPTPTETPPAPPPAGMWSGERLRAEVTVGGIPVGEYQLSVAPPCERDGRVLLPVSSRAERKGIVAAFTDNGATVASWLDVTTGRPAEAHAVIESRLSMKYFAVQFLGDRYHYVYERHNKRDARKYHYEQDRELPSHVPVHDIHSGLGLLRNWSREIGKRGTIYAVVGKTLWRLDVQVAEREEVSAGGTTYPAVRIDGNARRLNRDLKASKRVSAWSLWVSDEDARLPLKSRLDTRDGTVEADLLDYQQERVAQSAPSRCLFPTWLPSSTPAAAPENPAPPSE